MLCVLSAGGAPDPQWNGPQPGSAADPERDGTEEGQDSGFGGFWNSLQGQCVYLHLQLPVGVDVPIHMWGLRSINQTSVSQLNGKEDT